MSISVRFQLLLLLLLFILISLFISSTASGSGSAPTVSPSDAPVHVYPPTFIATILSRLGFEELSTAMASANLSASTPLTIFAPSDASVLTCSSCSLSLLLQELSLPGIYSFHFLRTLIFGTKIETLAPNRCLTITTNRQGKIFINGNEISHPDLFNNGLIVIHGLEGYVSHLSPLSCNVELMTSLSFPPSLSSTATYSMVRPMLKDIIIRLRFTGYSVVSLALQMKFTELSELTTMTIFALDDTAIFSREGNIYLSNFRFHIVPNKRLTAVELVSMPPTTSLPTMIAENYLVVTTAGGGGPLSPMRINYVKISTVDLLQNSKIVVHGISSPFPYMYHQPYDEKESRSAELQRPKCEHYDWNRRICATENVAPPPIESQPTLSIPDHRGL